MPMVLGEHDMARSPVLTPLDSYVQRRKEMEEQKKKGPGRPERYSHDTKLAILREWKRYQSNHNGRGSKRGFCRYCLPGELNPRTLDRILAYAFRAEAEYKAGKLLEPEDKQTPPPVIPNPFDPMPPEGAAQLQGSHETDGSVVTPDQDEADGNQVSWVWT